MKALEEKYFYLDLKKTPFLLHSKGSNSEIVKTQFYQAASSLT